jgi:hypothetical protein
MAVAAFEHDSLLLLRLFLRVKQEFQVSVRFQHQLRTWLNLVDRCMPGRDREMMALKDPLLLESLKVTRGSARGLLASRAGSGAVAAPAASTRQPVTHLSVDQVSSLMQAGRLLVTAAYAKDIEDRTKTSNTFLSKARSKVYSVVKLSIEGLTAGPENATVFMETNKSLKDFETLRRRLRRSRLPTEKDLWAAGSPAENVWARIKDVHRDELTNFEQLLRCLTSTGVNPYNTPTLWRFFTEEFEVLGGAGM